MQLKTKNGITLIALVVTIIVLLILAGVSINMALGNNGIFEKAKDAQNKMNEAIKSDMDEINSLTNLLDNYIGENVTGSEGTTSKFEFTGTTNPSDSYVGYYADINGDGEITEEADGIIFADLLQGGSGQWNNSSGAYSIGTISSAKSYKVSSSNYTEGKFGDAKVLQANGSGTDRFYVMALKDLDTSGHCWYHSAYYYNNDSGIGISDYNTVTSENFGTGKTNTSTMITKWNETAYGSKNGNASYPDVWGVVQTKYAQGWFVPSRAEWASFGDAFNITYSDYNSTYGLSIYYWSSSLVEMRAVWTLSFEEGCMNPYGTFTSRLSVRLCTTF